MRDEAKQNNNNHLIIIFCKILTGTRRCEYKKRPKTLKINLVNIIFYISLENKPTLKENEKVLVHVHIINYYLSITSSVIFNEY